MSTMARPLHGSILAVGGLGYLAALFVALVVLHLSPELVLALTLGAVLMLAIALRPYVGAHAFLMLMFFENALGSGSGLTPMKLLGSIILAGWLVSVMVRRSLGVRLNAMTVTLLAFLAWCGVSLTQSYDSGAAFSRVFSFVQLFMATLMFASVVNSARRLRGLFLATVGWTVLTTLIALAQYYAGATPMAQGLIGDRNSLAVFINVAVVCASLSYQRTGDSTRRVYLLAALPLLFLGLALTFSRGGLIGLILSLLLVWWRVAARRQGMVLIGGSLAALLVVLIFVPTEFRERASTIVPAIQRRADTFGTRVQLWQVGWRMVKDRPVFGVGPGNFTPAYPRYARAGEMLMLKYSSHNSYVAIAADTGVPGLMLFCGLCVLAVRAARRAGREAALAGHGDIGLLCAVIYINVIGLMVAALSLNIETQKILWVYIGLALGAAEWIPTALARQASRPAPTAGPAMAPAPSPALARVTGPVT